MRASVYREIEPRYGAYRRESARIGLTLLIFLLLFNGLDPLLSPLELRLFRPLSGTSRIIATRLWDMARYLIAFMLPALFHRLLTPKKARIPMALAPTLPKHTGMIILAAMAIILTSSLINDFVLRVTGLEAAGSSYTPPNTSAQPMQTVLFYMSSALVPAFCEEFLFRGLILPQLLPYGKTVAILGSGVLFGLMHQNNDQIIYATVAGIVLGYLVVQSGSIWIAVLVHSFNNLLSVIGDVLWNRLPYQAEMMLHSAIEVVVIGGGMICLAILLHRKEPPIRSDAPLRAGAPMAAGSIRGFFTLPMALFWIISLVIMVLWTYIRL